MRRRAAFQQVFVDRMAELLGVRTDRGRFACEVCVAAVSSMVTVPLIDGDDEALRRLRDPILDLVRQGLDVPLNPPGADDSVLRCLVPSLPLGACSTRST